MPVKNMKQHSQSSRLQRQAMLRAATTGMYRDRLIGFAIIAFLALLLLMR